MLTVTLPLPQEMRHEEILTSTSPIGVQWFDDSMRVEANVGLGALAQHDARHFIHAHFCQEAVCAHVEGRGLSPPLAVASLLHSPSFRGVKTRSRAASNTCLIGA